MILKLSSGRGPEECELAVGKLLDSFLKEFDSISLVESVEGNRKGTYKSAVLKCDTDISYIEGTVKWICNSPYRPTCKRKNWFVEIKVLEEIEKIDFDESEVEIETMRSPGRGGQNVNKVETGVRAVHVPMGTYTVCTQERSQNRNKAVAMERLRNRVMKINEERAEAQRSSDWNEISDIERGNPVRTYVGMRFLRAE